jgi:hypothetical protein
VVAAPAAGVVAAAAAARAALGLTCLAVGSHVADASSHSDAEYADAYARGRVHCRLLIVGLFSIILSAHGGSHVDGLISFHAAAADVAHLF